MILTTPSVMSTRPMNEKSTPRKYRSAGTGRVSTKAAFPAMSRVAPYIAITAPTPSITSPLLSGVAKS
jgi:hypothetical protein